jgi:hypothetical protein
MPINPDPSAALTTLTRIGFAARGLLYLVIAWLITSAGRIEDPSGALGYLSEGNGRYLVMLMIAGFVAYGIWRLSDATLNLERHPADRKGAGQRIGAAASGLIYLFLAWQAVRLLRGTGSGGGSGGGTQEGAQTALQLPGGTLLLFVAAAVLVGVGIMQLINAWRCKFAEHLEPSVRNENWVLWVGRGGYVARGVVFLISGYFLFRSAQDSQASQAGGMQEALAWLTSPWDLIVAVGLGLFGLFSLVEARYRVIHDVPVDEMAHKARGTASRLT